MIAIARLAATLALDTIAQAVDTLRSCVGLLCELAGDEPERPDVDRDSGHTMAGDAERAVAEELRTIASEIEAGAVRGVRFSWTPSAGSGFEVTYSGDRGQA